MLNELAKEIREIALSKGWDNLTPAIWQDKYIVPTFLALIHSETSEGLEAFRKNDKENFKEEMADMLIRVLDLAAGLEIDMDQAVADKMEKNRNRPFRHGGKKV